MKLKELLEEKTEPRKLHKTGVDFVDALFDGGFEQGRLISLTGEEESGKTKLLNQMISGLAKNEEFQYFPLEFNKHQLKQDFKNRVKHKNITPKAISNIDVITSDMIDPEIKEIIKHIKESDAKFIGIDSAMELYINGLKGEELVSGIYRELAKITKHDDKTIIIIGQSSKQDNREKRVSIFNSQLANHIVDIKLHMLYDLAKNERYFQIAKNKQNGVKTIIPVELEEKTLIFKAKSPKPKLKSAGSTQDLKQTQNVYSSKEEVVANKLKVTVVEGEQPNKEEEKLIDQLAGKGISFTEE